MHLPVGSLGLVKHVVVYNPKPLVFLFAQNCVWNLHGTSGDYAAFQIKVYLRVDCAGCDNTARLGFPWASHQGWLQVAELLFSKQLYTSAVCSRMLDEGLLNSIQFEVGLWTARASWPVKRRPLPRVCRVLRAVCVCVLNLGLSTCRQGRLYAHQVYACAYMWCVSEARPFSSASLADSAALPCILELLS